MKSTLDERLANLERSWSSALPDAPLPVAQRAFFLSLPTKKQELAIDRLMALSDFFAGAPMTFEYAEAHLGISRPRFYSMAAKFRRDPTISNLVPWSEPSRRKGRSDEDIGKIEGAIAYLIENSEPFGPDAVGRELAKRLGSLLPSRSTIYAISAAATPEIKDGMRLLPSWAARALPAIGASFGSAIIIDQISIGTERRILSLVMDGLTRFIIGWRFGEDDAEGLTQALLDAAQRYRSPGVPRASRGRPSRLIATLGSGPEWEVLADDLERSGFECILRRQPKYRVASLALRMLGGKIGGLDITRDARRANRRPVPHDEIVQAIEAHNQSRMLRYPELAVADEPTDAEDAATTGDPAIRDWLASSFEGFHAVNNDH